jgi:hypothetical protein
MHCVRSQGNPQTCWVLPTRFLAEEASSLLFPVMFRFSRMTSRAEDDSRNQVKGKVVPVVN